MIFFKSHIVQEKLSNVSEMRISFFLCNHKPGKTDNIWKQNIDQIILKFDVEDF